MQPLLLKSEFYEGSEFTFLHIHHSGTDHTHLWSKVSFQFPPFPSIKDQLNKSSVPFKNFFSRMWYDSGVWSPGWEWDSWSPQALLTDVRSVCSAALRPEYAPLPPVRSAHSESTWSQLFRPCWDDWWIRLCPTFPELFMKISTQMRLTLQFTRLLRRLLGHVADNKLDQVWTCWQETTIHVKATEH